MNYRIEDRLVRLLEELTLLAQAARKKLEDK